MSLTFGSLFVGIGGIDLGLERAGFVCRWQVEIDDKCRAVLAQHWPHVAKYEDVRNVGRHNLEPVGLICGGFPCQDLSVAGRRKGLAGERSGLFYEFMRVVADLAPKWVLIENVPGLLSSNGGRDMGAVIGALAELRYGWAYRCLDAQYFGVAQRRRRVFIVGCLGDGAAAAEVLFELESVYGDTPPRRETGQDTTTALTCGLGSGGADDNRAQAGWIVPAGIPDPAYAISSQGTKFGSGRHNQDTFVATFDERNVTSKVNRTRVEVGLPANTLHQNGLSVVAFTERTRADGRNFECQEGLAYALTNPGGGGRAHSRQIAQGMTVRRLAPIECERLQGFPDNWTVSSDSTRYRQLGNAVCVPVAEWIGRRIVAVENRLADAPGEVQ